MNHIYRLIWNTTLSCWVVASEHTRSRGKRTRAVRAAAAIFALALPLTAFASDDDLATEEEPVAASEFATALLRLNNDALLRSAGMSVAPFSSNFYLSATVNDPRYAAATLSGENSLVLGSRARVTGDRSTGIGNEVVVNGFGHTVMGSQASATGGLYAVAIGLNASTNGNGHVAIGDNATANTNGAGGNAVAIGAHARAGSTGWTGATAVGGEAVATYNGVALGYRTSAQHAGAMALGFNATAGSSYANAIGYQAEAAGGSSVAIGTLANSAASASIAVGDRSKVDATAANALALGYYAAVNANATNAVALGYGSVAVAANTVSVGSASLNRKIVNVADGEVSASSTDAVTGRQLHNRLNGQTIAFGENARPMGGRAVAIGHNAMVPTDGGVDGIAIGANSRGGSGGWTGGVAIGGNATADFDGLAVGYDAHALASSSIALGRGSVTNAGNTLSVGSDTIKRRIVNVADGALTAGSSETVTGKQLFATNQNVTTAKTAADAAKVDATAALTKANLVSGLIGQASAAGSVRVGAENTGTLLDVRNKANSNRTISGVADAALNAGSSEAVSGRQLFAVSARLDAQTVVLGEGASGAQNGVSIGNRAQASAGGAVALGANSVATAGNTVSVGNDTLKRRIVNVADASVTAGSSEAVTGKQLFATNQNVTTATNTANTAKTAADAAQVDASAALTKANLVSGLIGQASAAGSVRVGAENTGSQLDVRNKANANRTVSGVADAALNAGSSEAVSGRQLFAVSARLEGQTVVLGEGARPLGGRAIAIGANSLVDTQGGVDGIAIGSSARAGIHGYTGGIAVGGEAASDYDGVSMGYMAKAQAKRSVALGTSSVADAEQTVSVGNATLKRRVVNVADGRIASGSGDAVTGNQLFSTDQKVTTATNAAHAATTVADAAKVEAAAALTKADLVSGLIGEASVAGNVRVGAENTGSALDVRNKANANRTINGVADAALSVTSTEAVAGNQLFATNQQVTANGIAVGENRRDIGANRNDLDALRDDFDSYAPDLSGVVKYNADRTQVDLEGAGLTAVAAGEVSGTSREAVNGSQLFGTNERVGYLEHQQRYVMVGADESSLPAQAGNLGVAVGGDADAREEGATAVGTFATAKGRNSVALGRAAYVAPEGRDGFALGTRTRVQAVGGLAIGADSDVVAGADHSVALGNASVAKEANTVAVGNDGLKRRIVHVAPGTNDDNATSLGQLRETVAALGGGAAIDAAGQVIAPNYLLSGGAFNNVGDALTSLDTTLISHKTDLDTLDSRYQSLEQNDRSIKYNVDRSVVDFGGARVTGVADGSLSANSSDAVNGAQLFGTNERVGSLEQQQRYVMVGAIDANLSAKVGVLGVAIGGDAEARQEGATAVGSYAAALGRNSVALGRGAYVAPEARDGFALGTRTNVEAVGGMAIGAGSNVMSEAYQSIALGVASVATEANTVSVGAGEYRRRIVNVAQGIRANDATTVSQLRGALTALGGGADLDANGNVIGPRYAVQGSEYGSFGDAITALDGSVGDNKRNLDTLDSRFQRLFQESPSANADGSGRLSFGGAQGMVLGNVANGLIGQGSRDAVNGGQLWSVKQDLQGQIDALDPGKAEVSGAPLAMAGRSAPITPSADGGSNVTPSDATPPATDPGNVVAQDPLIKAEGDNAVAVGGEGKERTVKHVAEGRADTDAANVRQVNDALDRANAYTDSAMAGVNQRLDQVDKRINRMAAISSAQGAMAMNTAGLATTNRLGAGVGYSEGESAMAVGYQRVLTERGSATFSLNGAFTNSGEKSVGVGVGIGW